ncbi:MAG TPA: DegT/DnrJ/EryC1/StrS family aminotransferase [Burkholderiaceae bacterium]|jgi:dTDP-4-amino-4,6-dideoxygalactose transaminase
MSGLLTPRSELTRAIPKGPVFGWASLRSGASTPVVGVRDLPYKTFTTSGRAALYHALLQSALPPNSAVLVPTYHCPTMIAPVLLAGHRPSYFGIGPDGLPDLARIEASQADAARAMIVSHYFGLTQSLRDVRRWCDAHNIVLIEDCAHSYFGQAGERVVGAWGDYATTSLSKFFPLPEAGLLASAHRPLAALDLRSQGLTAELKGCVDVLETGVRFHRLAGLNSILGACFRFKARLRSRNNAGKDVIASDNSFDAEQLMRGCDMARIDARTLLASRALYASVRPSRVVALRRRNYDLYSAALGRLPGMEQLAGLPRNPAAPYVYPVWVEDADRVYHGLRALGVPVFRWDRIWPGTPRQAGDAGSSWSHHLLQMLCHQDLEVEDIEYSIHCLQRMIGSTLKAASPASPETQTEK